MDWLVIWTCLVVILAEASGTHLCSTAEECSAGYCCVAFDPFQLVGRGFCVRLAGERTICNEPEAKVHYFGGKYIWHCPCEEDFSCLPWNLRVGYDNRLIYFAHLRCQRTPWTTTEVTTQEITTAKTIVPKGYGHLCSTANECSAGLCCLAPTLVEMAGKGICLRLARKGTNCNEAEANIQYFGGKYIMHCPCEEGFSCLPWNLRAGNDNPLTYFTSLRCQKTPPTTTTEVTTTERIVDKVNGPPCSTADECMPGYCCVALGPIEMVGKGTCIRLATEGTICNEPEAQMYYYGGKYNLHCPCEWGFSCLPWNLTAGNDDPSTYFSSLRCQRTPSTTTEEVKTQEITTTERTMEEVTTQREIIEEMTTQEEKWEDTTIQEEVIEEEMTTQEEKWEDTTIQEEVIEEEMTTQEEKWEDTTIQEEVIEEEMTTQENLWEDTTNQEEIIDEWEDTTNQEEIIEEWEDTTNQEEIIEEWEDTTIQEEIMEESTTQEEIADELATEEEMEEEIKFVDTADETTSDDGRGDDVAGDEVTRDEITEDYGTGDEGTRDEEVGNEKFSDEAY